MLQSEILQNKQTLLNAAESVHWKTDRARTLTTNYFKGEQRPFDKRNIYNFAALAIDLSNIPENEKEAYFDGETQKIIEAFEGKRDIKPYLTQLYENITIEDNVDFSDEKAVENFLATVQLSQALNTVFRDFPKEMFALYPSCEDMERIDAIVSKADMIYYEFGALMNNTELQDSIQSLVPMGMGRSSFLQSPYTQVEREVNNAVYDAMLKEDKTVFLDATKNEHSKNFFFGKQIEMYDQAGEFSLNEDEYAKQYFTVLAQSSKHTAAEQWMVNTLEWASGEEKFQYENLLYINGKSIPEHRRELIEKNQYDWNGKAEHDLGRLLRDALTDGKSTVSLMRMSFAEDGTTKFTHQDIKIDLDQLNEVNRKENYSIFRRFLDWAGIWKIPSYPTNAQRDANLQKAKEDPNYSKMLRERENKVINIYNQANLKDAATRKVLMDTVPKISRVEDPAEKQTGEVSVEQSNTRIEAISTEREHIPNIDLNDGEKAIPIEPPKKIEELTNVKENLTK